jgi:hypothetical protein
MDRIPRREARKIIAGATRVLHRYESLEPLRRHPVEIEEVAREVLVNLFEKNPRWRVFRFSDGSYGIAVPNIYANESYLVER